MRGKLVAMAVLLGLAFGVSGCGRGDTFKTASQTQSAPTAFPNPPDRPAFEHCAWKHVEGAGVRLWSQECNPYAASQRLTPDAQRPVLWSEATIAGETTRSRALIVFSKSKEGGIEEIMPAVFAEAPAPAGATCAFEPAPNVIDARTGVKRFILVPTGASRTAWERDVSGDMVPQNGPCGELGVAPVGDRYFEIQDAHPETVVFVELGSEIQIYDPGTLEIVAAGAHGAGGHGATHHEGAEKH